MNDAAGLPQFVAILYFYALLQRRSSRIANLTRSSCCFGHAVRLRSVARRPPTAHFQ